MNTISASSADSAVAAIACPAGSSRIAAALQHDAIVIVASPTGRRSHNRSEAKHTAHQSQKDPTGAWPHETSEAAVASTSRSPVSGGSQWRPWGTRFDFGLRSLTPRDERGAAHRPVAVDRAWDA